MAAGAFDDVDRLVVLAPVEPARTGNGLAMRTALFCRSVPPGVEVIAVVVPVAGHTGVQTSDVTRVTVVPSDAALARSGVRELLREPVWRERLSRVAPLPSLARVASPALADAVVQACSGSGRVALHVVRSYLAPLGVAVAERLHPAWFTLDLDDDDAALAAKLGDLVAAAAYDRLLCIFGGLFHAVAAASSTEAQAIAQRQKLAIECLPNAVDLPEREPRSRDDRRRYLSLLFVGNLTYRPNVEAAQILAEEILPRIHRRLSSDVRVTLVGRHHRELERLASPTVKLAGYVSDLGSVYADADVVVVPLRVGGGSRIKLLEAFAYGVPVVASASAAAGLDVTDGRHFALAPDSDDAAAAIEAIATQAVWAAQMTQAARELVRTRYSTEVVGRLIGRFFDGAAARGHVEAQLTESS